MKKLFLILAVIFCIEAKANHADTLKIDSVKNAIQVTPVVINSLQKDTLYQVSWSVDKIYRKDTTGATSYAYFFDRKGRYFAETKVRIPYSVLSVWLDDVVIDDYILTFLGLQKRQ